MLWVVSYKLATQQTSPPAPVGINHENGQRTAHSQPSPAQPSPASRESVLYDLQFSFDRLTADVSLPFHEHCL